MWTGVVVLVGLAVVGCGTIEDRTQAANVIVVATATANEPAAILPADFDAVLRAANESRRGTLTVLVPRDGRAEQIGDPIDVKVTRDGSEMENNEGLIDAGIAKIGDEVRGRTSAAASNERQLDLLTGLAEASRRADKSTIVLISSGLQTTGLIDFAALGWDFDDNAVIGQLRDDGFVPDLSGKKVMFVGLGETAGVQQALPQPMRAKVEGLWLDLCRAGGAAECTKAAMTQLDPPVSTTPARTVDVPRFELPALPSAGEVQVSVPTQALFAPDSAELLPSAEGQLSALASELVARGASIDLVGHTWRVGQADSARALSLQRASAVADALVRNGFPRGSIGELRGAGYDEPIVVPGADELQTAQANRVVIVTIRTSH
ncbi:OmpA family protein [Mycolicibacterium cosmeticum]|uniref:OmpA family protein n=1 Tax=Mycolicibacterium cosmeticum TaxID=258533 RepID=UPI003204C69D